MRSLCLCPAQQVAEGRRRYAPLIVLAVYEPRLEVPTAVDVGVLALADDVAAAIGGAAIEIGALAPVEVDEAEFVEELKAELLEVGLVEPVTG